MLYVLLRFKNKNKVFEIKLFVKQAISKYEKSLNPYFLTLTYYLIKAESDSVAIIFIGKML